MKPRGRDRLDTRDHRTTQAHSSRSSQPLHNRADAKPRLVTPGGCRLPRLAADCAPPQLPSGWRPQLHWQHLKRLAAAVNCSTRLTAAVATRQAPDSLGLHGSRPGHQSSPASATGGWSAAPALPPVSAGVPAEGWLEAGFCEAPAGAPASGRPGAEASAVARAHSMMCSVLCMKRASVGSSRLACGTRQARHRCGCAAHRPRIGPGGQGCRRPYGCG